MYASTAAWFAPGKITALVAFMAVPTVASFPPLSALLHEDDDSLLGITGLPPLYGASGWEGLEPAEWLGSDAAGRPSGELFPPTMYGGTPLLAFCSPSVAPFLGITAFPGAAA